jgi:hypothetical protein
LVSSNQLGSIQYPVSNDAGLLTFNIQQLAAKHPESSNW